MSDTIFVGKAVRVEKQQKSSFKTETTVFEVTEVFSGDEATGSIWVRNKSGFSCDVEFTIGETYLVFASGSKQDGYGTGFCSGNRPVQYSATEISELRKLLGSKGDGQLLGTVYEEFAKRSIDEERAPIKDVRIEITEASSGRKYTAKTNDNGRFQIAVPPGTYKVAPVVPPKAVMASTFEAEPVQLRSGGCAESYFVLSNRSVVAGRLLDSEGDPVSNASVELVPADAIRSYLGGMSSDSNANGEFSIDEIPAGKYTLSVNYNSNPQPDRPFPTTFYPSGNDRSVASILEIKAGSRITGLTWQLPKPLEQQLIKGKVVWDDGSPVVGAELKTFDMAFPGFYAGCYLLEKRKKAETTDSPVRTTSFNLSGPVCDLKSDSTGLFQMTMYAGRTYSVEASLTRIVAGQKIEHKVKSEPFTLSNQPQTVNLVIKKK
ncbi:MAG: carboxypeptidase regulatory-like domain-containing protein [Saprospiraceae bacterium]|nr:carboxypeptidase regulatory-like domain-containing protein [Pyrinomonadaceae bacterium]